MEKVLFEMATAVPGRSSNVRMRRSSTSVMTSAWRDRSMFHPSGIDRLVSLPSSSDSTMLHTPS